MQRLSRGLAFSANYTLSKAIDDASDPGATTYETNLPQDVRNMDAERALASFDHRHRFVGNVTYALPGRERAGRLDGWRVNGIVTLQSGAPFTVNLGTDRANIGSGPAQRPDVSCDPNAGGAQTAAQWFNTSCFSLPAAVHVRQLGTEHRARARLRRRRRSRFRRTSLCQTARVSSCAGRSSICFNRRTSTCRTGSPSRRTSAASSAPAPPGRCNSASSSSSNEHLREETKEA